MSEIHDNEQNPNKLQTLKIFRLDKKEDDRTKNNNINCLKDVFYEEEKKKKKKKNKKKREKNTESCNEIIRTNMKPVEYVEKIMSIEEFIFYNKRLYRYNKNCGYFELLEDHPAKVLINNYLKKYHLDIKTSLINEILSLIKLQEEIQVIEEIVPNCNLINFKNGVLNLKTRRIVEWSDDYMFFNSINGRCVKYDKEAFKKSRFKKFLDDITNEDKETQKIIQEIFGYTLSNYNNSKKLFIFLGESNCGKSVLLQVLTNILGKDNVSNIPLQDLKRDDYIASLFGKKANICAELPDNFFQDVGIIKKLVSENDDINARRLNEATFSFVNRSKLIAACNNLPSINPKKDIDNEAFFNRLIIVACHKNVKDEELNPNLLNELMEERDIIISWMIKGLYRYIENGCKFSRCKISENILNTYAVKNSKGCNKDIIKSFVDDFIIEEGKTHFYKIEEKFREYVLDKFDIEIGKEALVSLKKYIDERYWGMVEYKKFRLNGENRYGFIGISLRQDIPVNNNITII